ncbi:MAG TPA: caspase family protein, partial [Coleofasciculaceae cyanobacterium]
MSSIKRRHFLQAAGSTLAAIGLSQIDFLTQADRYGKVLAQSTPRKLALLVGINQYQSIRGLNGCLNDVKLQKHLLIHRFGFNPQDIYEVSDETDLKPTRDNILSAFDEYLIKQAKPGDVVVFHYSGHGDLVRDPNPIRDAACENSICQFNGTLVPMNAAAIGETASEVIVPDIMGRTLFLLMSAIQTENLTVILDSCHSGAGTRGNVVVRAAQSRTTRAGQTSVASPAEQEFQESLRSRFYPSFADFQNARQAGIAKGVALGSAQRNQEAIDAVIGSAPNAINAGGFTYLLTRYLWQQTSSDTAETAHARLELATNSLSETARNGISQIPTFEYQPNSTHNRKPLYFLPTSRIAAEAVITNADNMQQIEFWLGGVVSQSFENNGSGNTFTLLDANGNAVGEIEQTDRRGFHGYGKLTKGRSQDAVNGRLLREHIVGLPTDLSL